MDWNSTDKFSFGVPNKARQWILLFSDKTQRESAIRSVQFRHSVMSNSLRPPWIAACQASPSIATCWSSPKLMCVKSVMHPAISPSVVPFSSCPQSLPPSGSFPMSQLFTWGGQSIGVSTSASVLPVNNTQDWSPLGQTGWISMQSKGPSRVFSNTTVQKHQFFSAQPSMLYIYIYMHL